MPRLLVLLVFLLDIILIDLAEAKAKVRHDAGISELESEDEFQFEIRTVIQNNPMILDLLRREQNFSNMQPQDFLPQIPDLREAYSAYFAQEVNESVNFYLYDDRSNPWTYKEIDPEDDDSIKMIRVPEGTTLKILIHGFTGELNNSFPQDTKDAYLENTNHPVIIVDWSSMAGVPELTTFKQVAELVLYFGIVDRNIPRVGEYVGKFIAKLMTLKVITSLQEVHVIGHSLGAHVSGEVGQTVQKELEGAMIGRITGLDPAGPHFENKTFDHRLDESDAEFVDIIHTSYLLGDRRSTGHVDFYPNSEAFPQPGCSRTNETIVRAVMDAFIGSCDHHRAVDFHIQSITDSEMYGCQFLESEEPTTEPPNTIRRLFAGRIGSVRRRNRRLYRLRKCDVMNCDESVVFGEHVSHSIRGEYCLKTDSENEEDTSEPPTTEAPVRREPTRSKSIMPKFPSLPPISFGGFRGRSK